MSTRHFWILSLLAATAFLAGCASSREAAQVISDRADALCRSAESFVADRGFDFIQTDWLLACAQFLERTGRRRPKTIGTQNVLTHVWHGR